MRGVRIGLTVAGPNIVPVGGGFLMLEELSAGTSVDVTWLDEIGQERGTITLQDGRGVRPGFEFFGFSISCSAPAAAVFLVGPPLAEVLEPPGGAAAGGGLTDAELRATAVPVSGPLTDAQLRATAVPVSGPLTDAELRATAVPVSGPLTDAQLRATAVPVAGGKTSNNAAPGATNLGALIGIANDALPSYTEGNLVIPAVDLRGVLRMISVPMAALGIYELTFDTGVYNGLAANTPLFSFRWGDASRFCILLRFLIEVVTSTAATTAGNTERQLIIARSFSASDTAGTPATLTGNNQKRRTSMGSSLMTDMRWGAPITAGTRTLDAHPIGTAVGWSGLLSTGVSIGASGTAAVGAARSTEGTTGMVPLYDSLSGRDHPQTFGQNEGAVMRIGLAQPAASVQRTFGKVLWLEANKIL